MATRLRAAAGALVALGLWLLAGCASRSGYLTDRGRDAADIVTLSAGRGTVALARVGPLGAGLGVHVPSSGLRGGAWLPDDFYALNGAVPGLPGNCDAALLLVGGQSFTGDATARNRGKAVRSDLRLGLCLPHRWLTDRPREDGSEEAPRPSRVRDGEQRCAFGSYFTQIELFAGVFRTLHVGVNPGELADFLLGWTTLDVFGDDLGTDQKENQEPDPSKPPAPESE